MAEYVVAIEAPINGVNTYFFLDNCTARTVTSHATLAQYPVQSGETISDHMYRDARVVELSGKFSEDGKWSSENNNQSSYTTNSWESESVGKNWKEFYGEKADGFAFKDINNMTRMKRVQTLFEWIQAKGILCKILMLEYDKGKVLNDHSFGFKMRENMALENIRWTEGVNSMDYAFTWKEVLQVNPYEGVGEFDYNSEYPNTEMPAIKSLSEIAQDSGQFLEVIVLALIDAEILIPEDLKCFLATNTSDSFFKSSYNYSKLEEAIEKAVKTYESLMSSAFFLYGLSGAIAGGALIAAAMGVATAGIGFLVGAVLLAAAGVINYLGSRQEKKANKARQYSNAIRLVNNYEQYIDKNTGKLLVNDIDPSNRNLTNIGRLQILLEDLQNAFQNALSGMTFYSLENLIEPAKISENDAYKDVLRGSGYLMVGSDLLKFTIERKISEENFEGPFQLIKNPENTSQEIVSPYFGFAVVTSPFDMDPNANMLYSDSSRNYQLYLYNPRFYEKGLSIEDKLKSYYFVVVEGDVKRQLKKFEQSIANVLKNRGYAE